MEVDTNSQIIHLVQSRPVLYSKCNDFRARSNQWKEIADILKVDVSWVKSRWHLLRTKFLTEYSLELKGTRSNFKYFNDMSFIVNHTNIKAFEMHTKQNELGTQPEFVIDKKDLEDESDDDSSNIFMELELDEGTNKEVIAIPQSYDLPRDISEDELDEALYLTTDRFSPHQQLTKTSTKYKLGSQVETFQIVEVREMEDLATIHAKENTKEKVEETNDVKISCGDSENPCTVQEEQQPEMPKPIPEDFEVSRPFSAKAEKHRCEDTIFGELVIATLRKMESEKKKAVKREIMNILFT